MPALLKAKGADTAQRDNHEPEISTLNYSDGFLLVVGFWRGDRQ